MGAGFDDDIGFPPPTIPIPLGSSGTFLQSQGAGSPLVWATGAGGGSPGGSSFSTQFNNAGAFGGAGPGSAGQVLTSNGGALAPTFQTVSGTGTVTSVATDATLTGGPITISGTLGINLANANTWIGAQTFTGAITTAARIQKIRTVIAAGAVTLVSGDDVVEVNKTVGAATTVNLPGSPLTGETHTIIDGKGDANVNHITLTPASGNINNAATFVMNSAHAATSIIYDGSQWVVY